MTNLEEALQREATVLRESLTLDVAAVTEVLRRVERVHLVGTGTSQHAAELGVWILRRCGLDARWWSSATAARAVEWRHDAVVVISHTGETAFARAVRDQVLRADMVHASSVSG